MRSCGCLQSVLCKWGEFFGSKNSHLNCRGAKGISFVSPAIVWNVEKVFEGIFWCTGEGVSLIWVKSSTLSALKKWVTFFSKTNEQKNYAVMKSWFYLESSPSSGSFMRCFSIAPKVVINPNYEVAESDYSNNVMKCRSRYDGQRIWMYNCHIGERSWLLSEPFVFPLPCACLHAR